MFKPFPTGCICPENVAAICNDILNKYDIVFVLAIREMSIEGAL